MSLRQDSTLKPRGISNSVCRSRYTWQLTGGRNQCIEHMNPVASILNGQEK